MTTHGYNTNCEHVSGISTGHQERGWAPQHIWGLDIDRRVMTKMLKQRFGPQGYALCLVDGDLFKVWAPSEISKVGETSQTGASLEFIRCAELS